MSYQIRPFRPADTQGVVDLIIPIQQGEFGVPVTLQDQPDLLDIENFYQRQGGFWVAEAEGRIIGSIALIRFGTAQAALRKMFVAAPWRGRAHGVGQALLETLLAQARGQGIVEITLGTVEILRAACRFYERNGFVAVAKADLPPAYPRMAVDTLFYQLRLG
ncbi:GNAT family N-acetyltransferase [Acidocella facilis]|uniref:GNAT family N-acetyltransferase n=1 Tax=Acidocella facilis TaxID=525 RepID=UPI001F231F65|nr:GNAT family N-acetyltransferase [Acidocella facilis]